jgi:c(7)-type cytochrome triheme protein
MQFRLTVLALLLLLAAPMSGWGLETKDVKFPMKGADPVTFSHQVHLKQYSNNCKICHNAIFNLKDKRHYTMAEMEKTKSCGACHSGVRAFSVADGKSCVRCHKGKPRDVNYSVKGFGEALFSHSVHLGKVDGDCKACHSKIITGHDGRVTMAQMEKGKTCGACHNGKRAFTVAGNCGNCHKGMKPRTITFNAKGVTPATFSHDLHLAAFTCKDCHTKVFPFKAGAKHFTMGEMEKGKSCGACHNGKEAFSAAGDCNKCHKGYRPGPITFKTSGIGNAKFSHDFHLEAYKCADCHTKIFPFKAGAKKHTMGDMEHGKSCGACHNGKDAFTSNGDCEKCHAM